jgi:hypothetical protein
MGAYTLTVVDPSLPKGEPLQIMGLGTFDNGASTEISHEQAEAFRDYHSGQRGVFDKEGNLKGYEWQRGPTLLEWAKGSEVVAVETVQEKASQKDDKDKGGDK